MSEIDANIIVDGQKTVATIPQEGEIVKDGGEIDATCIVEDSNGKRHKAVKIVNVDDEPADKSEIDAQILNNNNELITVTEEQEGEVIPQDNSEIDFHCLVQKDDGKQLLVKTVELDGEIIKTGGAIDTTCLVQGSNGKKQLAVKVFKTGGGEIIETVFGTNSITLPKAKANGLKSVKLFGGCEQSGTPTPTTPQDIISNNGAIKYSANMANVNAQTVLTGYYISAQGKVLQSTYNWFYQDFIPVKPNTTYTLSFSDGLYYVSIHEYSTANDSGFIRRNTKQTSTSSAPFDVTFMTITTSATTNYIRFGSNMYKNQVLTLDDVLSINWMLNKGNSLPYAPYSPNGIYTDGTVETINVHGKNLFDIADADWGYNINASGVRAVSQYNSNSNYIKVKPNTQYTCSWVSHSGSDSVVIRFHAYNSSKTWLEQIGTKNYSSDGLQTYTFTTSANTEYVIFTFRGSSSSASDLSTNIQLELGSTATEYAPYYDGGTATAEMLLKVGDYTDVQEILSGEVTRNVGVKVFDGTEIWVANTVSSGRLVFYITKASIGSNSTVLPNGSPNIKCSHFETSTAAAQSLYGTVWAGGTAINFTAGDFCANLTAWRQWLANQYAAGTPVIIIYPLATPTTETVTGQVLTTQAGTNMISITQASISSLDLEAKYKRSI